MFKLKCIVAVLTSYPVHFGGLLIASKFLNLM